jgi:hypothetical protein
LLRQGIGNNTRISYLPGSRMDPPNLVTSTEGIDKTRTKENESKIPSVEGIDTLSSFK